MLQNVTQKNLSIIFQKSYVIDRNLKVGRIISFWTLTLYKWPCYYDLHVASRVQHLSQNTIAFAIPALALKLFERHLTMIQVTYYFWLMTDYSSWVHYCYLLVMLWCLVLTSRLLNYWRLLDWWTILNLLHCSLISILHYSLLTFTKHLLRVMSPSNAIVLG